MRSDIDHPAFRRGTSLWSPAHFEFAILLWILVVSLPAMTVIPRAKAALETARLEAIRVNLRVIAKAKNEWAAENKKDGNAIPSETDLTPYLPGGRFPQPVVDETYRINAIRVAPVAVTPTKLLAIPRGGTITLNTDNWLLNTASFPTSATPPRVPAASGASSGTRCTTGAA